MPGIAHPVKSSISAKIIILLVVCLSSIISVSATVSYLLQRRELIRERDIQSVYRVERLALTMSSPLWNFDLDQLDLLASAEIKGVGPVGVLVWTPDGRLLLEKMRTPAEAGSRSAAGGVLVGDKDPPGMHVVRHDIRRDQQVLGTVQIVYDDRQVDKVLAFLLADECIKGLVLLITTGIVLYLGLSRILLKRLQTVYIAAREFGSGNLSGRLQVDEHDEIGVLSATFNRMADRICNKISQLEGAFDEVKLLKGVLDDIIDSLPSIIVVVNRDAEVVLWNRQAEHFTGISSINAAGSSVETLLPQFSDCLRQSGEVLARQRPYVIQKHAVVHGDEQSWYSVQLVPLVSEQNCQVVVRIDDITEHARLEDIMVQNEKMAMVSSLATGMAHEINNPLAAMLQNAQNIERRISPDLPANAEAAREAGITLDALNSYLQKRGIPGFITHIREAGTRISKIINNMLRFSSRGEPRRESADLATVLEQTLELAASDYDMKKLFDFPHIVIIREYEPHLPPVMITVSEIEHVLLNVLKNAAQAASASRGVRIPQIFLRTRHAGQMSVVEIEDNGPGMNETVQRRIFEPFYTTRDVGEGAGLGLSVSYAIITNTYNGRLDVQSRAGEGTCFSISIPSSGGGT